MKFFKIILLASDLFSTTSCDLAYWDCKREMQNEGYGAQAIAKACRGN